MSNISSILSSLPYQDPSRVKKDLSSAASIYRSLSPSRSTYFPPSDNPVDLICLSGTVAMFHKGSQYNIPVDIYVPLAYPSRPPLTYVRPTPSMALKSGHRHVDREGLVYMPYLAEWRGVTHTLVKMCEHLSGIFGQDPPVYARSQAVQGQAQQQQQQQQYSGETARPPPSYGDVAPGAAAARPPPPSYTTATTDNSTDASSSSLDTLTLKIQSHLQTYYNETRTKISAALKQQQALQAGAAEISGQHSGLRRMKDDLVAAIADVDKKAEALALALEEKEKAADAKVDPDLMVVGFDANASKMLELCAQSASIEDAIYYLDRAVNNGTLGVDESLKEIRKLARKQFLAKAHIKKIVEGTTGERDYQLR